MNDTLPSVPISGKDLIDAGWTPGPAIGKALAATRAMDADDPAAAMLQLTKVRADPNSYLSDPHWRPVAEALLLERRLASKPNPPKLGSPRPYPIWGVSLIDPGAIAQMDVAMSLPVSTRGALMPDAHVGYGLPIGGVLETKDVVIPYAVGSDIACRMRLTVLDAQADLIESDHDRLKEALVQGTVFGAGKETGRRIESPVLEADWSATPLLRTLKDLARRQIGTSGSGNHFVEWGTVDWDGRSLLALMSHSGSRGVGFKIADHYSKLAEKIRVYDLPPDAIRLSWLELNTDPGREYWTSMELAGRFASENHAAIHRRVIELAMLNGFELDVVENHHNFAWAESALDGSVSVVHRKGATPAGQGVMGVIPGSMGAPGYVVSGRGNAASLESASHGAGRAMGRRQAERSLTREDRDRILAEGNITLIGGGLDESPQAYKSIEDVIAAQSDLVEVTAKFAPRIVRMDTGSRDI
jgi:tRNA-splicing ligase RtcB (3'-phosphate/5'-hydroxy nucleic acid ligase)